MAIFIVVGVMAEVVDYVSGKILEDAKTMLKVLNAVIFSASKIRKASL